MEFRVICAQSLIARVDAPIAFHGAVGLFRRPPGKGNLIHLYICDADAGRGRRWRRLACLVRRATGGVERCQLYEGVGMVAALARPLPASVHMPLP